MKKLLSLFALILVFSLSAAHIGYLYPAGGRRGTSIELVVGGQGLYAPKFDITGTGIKLLSLERVPGLPRPDGKQNKYLRDWIKQIEKGDRTQPPLPESTEGWRKCVWWDRLGSLSPLQYELTTRSLYTQPNPLQMSPSINELVILSLEIAPDATLGEREIRLGSYGNWSNPAKFTVGDLPECNEPRFPVPPAESTPPEVRPPAVLNGQILPGETDSFRLPLKKGDTWTFTVTARHLLPYIGDAVPGYFQSVLRLLDADGKEAAFADDDYFNPDPTLRFTVPKDDVYTLEVRDALYRGREDFVYRVAIRPGPQPYPMAPPQTGKYWRNGTLAKPGDEAWFDIPLQKDETVVAEVLARRRNSPLDSFLQLYDPAGKIVAENDDCKRPLVGEIIQNADSLVQYTAPAAGRYRLRLTDRGGNGGSDYQYSLRIGPQEPEFKLYIAPSAVGVRMFDHEPLKIQVERIDGFDGEIKLKTNSQYYHFSGNAVVPAGADEALVTLTANPGFRPTLERLTVTGIAPDSARVNAVPCDEAMQAFAYTHWVPAQELVVANQGTRGILRKAQFSDQLLTLTPGGEIQQKCQIPNLPANAKLTATLRGVPNTLSVHKLTLTSRPKILWFVTAAPDAKPGRWNAVVEFTAEIPQSPNKEGKPRKPRKETFQLPAFPIEIR